MEHQESVEGKPVSAIGRLSNNKFVRIFLRRPYTYSASLVAVLFLVSLFPLPFGEISDLKTKNPTTTAFIAQDELEANATGKSFHKLQKWIPLNRMPKHLIDAVVVAEDGTFWSHSGFDWFELRESVERNLEEGRAARGASTISQQLVKNLFLSPSKNPLRKLREWVLTWYMEMKLSKSRILEIYLNVIEWGDGIYGVEAASQYYFSKSAADLSMDEATRLAAVIPSPTRHRPDEDSPYVVRRAAIVLERMRARGMIEVVSDTVSADTATLKGDSTLIPTDSLFVPDTGRRRAVDSTIIEEDL